MVLTRSGQAPLYTGVEIPQTPIEGGLNIDDQIHIDAHDPDQLVRVRHVLNDGKDIFASFDIATNAKTTSFDSAGDLRCKDVRASGAMFVGSNAIDVEDTFESIEADHNATESTLFDHAALLTAATAEDHTQSATLVKRDPVSGTKIDNLHIIADASDTTYTGMGATGFPPRGLYFTHGLCSTNLDLIGDAQLSFLPVDAQDNVITDRRFMFGRAQPYVGETLETSDPRRDGLLIEDAATDNSTEIMCSNELPSIRLAGLKTRDGNNDPSVPVIDVQDDQGNTTFSVWDDGRIILDRVICDYLQPLTGDTFKEIRVRNLKARNRSVWLGDKLHISESGARAQMQYRKDTIPVYLQGLGVNEAAVVALGKTIATATLEDWEALSVAASGSDDLGVIFDPTNAAQDFDLRTTFNELLVKPHVDDASAGIHINQPTVGHPCIFFEGNAAQPGGGYGLLQFGDQNAAKSMIYSSSADGDFHIDQFTGSVQIDAPNLNLSAGCTLTLDGVDVHNGLTTQVLLDAETSARQAADSTLTTAVNAEKTRIDAILNLSNADLDTLREIEDAFKAADSSIDTTVTNLQSGHNADKATATADRDDIRSDFAAADVVVTTAHVAADAVVTAAQLVITNALDGRLDTIEVDNATQTELDVVQALVDVNTAKTGISSPQASAITANTAKVGITSSQAGEITANTAKTGISSSQASAITANTAKTGISSSQAGEITANTAKTGISSSQASAITANTAKVGISSSQASAITANTAKTGITSSQASEITANTAKVSYTDASTVSSHVALHTQHTASLALKLNTTGHQQMNGRLTVHHSGNGEVANSHADDLQVYFYNDCGITIGCPEGKIGTLAFSDQNKADRNQIRAYSTVRDSRNIGMHFLANQADTEVPSLSVTDQLVGINNAQPSYALDVSGTLSCTSILKADDQITPEYILIPTNTYTSTGAAYQLPDNKLDIRVIYGDGSTTVPTIAYVKLPADPPDWCRVELNSTTHSNQTTNCLWVFWPGDSEQSFVNTDGSVETTGTVSVNSPSNTAHSKRLHYIYESSGKRWIPFVDMN